MDKAVSQLEKDIPRDKFGLELPHFVAAVMRIREGVHWAASFSPKDCCVDSEMSDAI